MAGSGGPAQLVAGLQQLPPPGASAQEVLFRRMLLQCCQHAVAAQQQRAGAAAAGTQQLAGGPLASWREDAKFSVVLDALQEKLYELEHASAAVRPGPDVLRQYKALVQALASERQPPQLPAYCLRAGGGGGSAVANGSSAAAAAAAGRGRLGAAGSKQRLAGEQAAPGRQQQQQQHSPRQLGARSPEPRTAHASADADGGSEQARVQQEGSFSLSAKAQEQLRTQQRLQDALTDELLDMGAELKSSTLAMQNAIRYRGKLLEDTETHLVASADNAKAAAAKAKEQYRTGSWNMCHTCIILLATALIFSSMIVMIRLSAMVGIKGS